MDGKYRDLHQIKHLTLTTLTEGDVSITKACPNFESRTFTVFYNHKIDRKELTVHTFFLERN